MAEEITKKYLDPIGLGHYDEKIKKVISDGDAATLQSAKEYSDSLADNYDAVGTAQTKVDELANGQVKTNKEAIEKLNGADTVEGSVAKTVKDAKTAVEAEIQAHKDAVDGKLTTLIGTDVDKSVRKIANEELAAQLIPDGAKESLDTLQEIAAWIQQHPDDAAAMNNAIDGIKTLVGTIPEGATSTTIVAYIKELVDAEKTRATGVEDGLDKRVKAVEGLVGEGGSVDDKIATAKSEAIAAAATDATTKADKALADAKTYADGKVKGLEDGQVATNKSDIASVKTRVEALEAVKFVAIKNDEIDALFAAPQA